MLSKNTNMASKSVVAVLVLSHLMDHKGRLNAESAARASRAYEVFNELGCDFLITSGWDYRKDTSICIGEAVKEFLIKHYNINRKYIISECSSKDTVGDAIFVKYNVVLPRNMSHLYIVTSGYHVPRVREIFNYFFSNTATIEVFGVDTDNDSVADIIEHEKKSIESFHETFNNVNPNKKVEVFRALSEIHPFYNGKIFPK